MSMLYSCATETLEPTVQTVQETAEVLFVEERVDAQNAFDGYRLRSGGV